MVKVYGRITSSNVMKVLWTLSELGLDYDRVDAGMAYGVVDTPEYRAMNPNGRVPTVQDGELILWESNAIVRYLAAKHGGDALSMADIPLGPNVHRFFNLDFERPKLPNVRAWYDRMCERPAFQQHVSGIPIE